MLKGTVKFFQKAKGFGFITPDGGGNEVFLPAAAIAAADVPRLKPGQRVSFEQAPDAKGPKVVSLTLLEAPPPVAPRPAQPRLTVFYNPAAASSDEVLQELGALGHEMRMVDVMTAPPTPDELKKLSLMLGGSKMGLVRRYDPLFMALQLDDRFITEGEFWTAISQHPALINGPVLQMSGRAGVCKTRGDVRAFCGQDGPAVDAPRKTISARLAALMNGQPLPPAPAKIEKAEKIEKPAAPEARTEAKPAKTKAVAKPAPKPAPKAVKAAKAKPAAKPAKKAAPAKAAKPAKKKR